MLEKVNLKKELAKDEYRSQLGRMQERLRVLQRAAFEAQLATTIVLEGWDASGKGTLVARLVEKLDPRGFRVRPTYAPTIDELYRPWLWRFWQRLPAQGEMAVFDRSWYGRVLVERVERLVNRDQVEQAFTEVREFERQLVDDGQVLVKLFLHMSRKEQHRRFERIEKDTFLRWKIKPEDWRHHRQYERYYEVTQEMLEATSTTDAAWTLIPANDRRTCEVESFKTIIAAIERQLAAVGKLPPADATVGNLAARHAEMSKPKPKPKPKSKPKPKKPAKARSAHA